MSEIPASSATAQLLELIGAGFPVETWEANAALLRELSDGLNRNDPDAVSGTLLLLKMELTNQKLNAREYQFFASLLQAQAVGAEEAMRGQLEKTSHELSALAHARALGGSSSA